MNNNTPDPGGLDPVYIHALQERAARDARAAVLRLRELGISHADRRRRQPVTLGMLHHAAAAARVERWERAGHVPRLDPTLPSSAELDAELHFVRDHRDKPIPSTGKFSPPAQPAFAGRALNGRVICLWRDHMVHVPLTSDPDADLELVAPAEASVDGLLLDLFAELLAGAASPGQLDVPSEARPHLSSEGGPQ